MATIASCPDASEILDKRFCLENLSKNARGELRLSSGDREKCGEPRCVTFKTTHVLKVEAKSGPCDSSLGKHFDGTFVVEKLATAFQIDGEHRGCHAGDFTWHGTGVTAKGSITGITNAGTHRRPIFDPCQECHAPGFMEGLFCGTVVETTIGELRECQIKGTYRFRFDPSIGAQSTSIEGVLEGVVICPCRG